MSNTGLYIHVPFCAKKCAYCDFYSGSYSRKDSDDYTDAVIRNLRHYAAESLTADTVYFGGGTPSLLSGEQLKKIMDEINRGFTLSPDAEVTLEANPSTLTPEKLKSIHEAGVNRLSIGVQSMSDSELKFLGRNHTAERAAKAVTDAQDSGFSNISCDLMIGLLGQTPDSVYSSINALSKLDIQHISAYILKVEKGTPFDCDEVRSLLPDDEATSDLYLAMVNTMEAHGFMQYEVSNFAKSGFESRHNCRYWKCEDYIGIGPSAHSCHGGKRFAVANSTREFIESPVQNITITDDSPCGFEEYAMLRLRLKEGLDLRRVPENRLDIEKKLPQLMREGYINYENDIVSLTAKGFLMSNSVIEYLIF